MGLRRRRGRIAGFRITAAQVAAVAREIEARQGDRIRAVHEDAPLRLRIAFEGTSGRVDLVVVVAPDHPAVFLDAARPAPPSPSPLAATLRTHLTRARLVGAEAVPGERALCVRFARGDAAPVLWIELFGRQAGAYLVDAAGLVLVAPRGAEAGRREASVGQTFRPTPPAPDRLEPAIEADGVSADLARAWKEALAARAFTNRRTAVARIVKSGLRAAKERLRRLEGDLARADDAARLRKHGELLQGAFHLLRPGLAEVVVPDYSVDPPAEVTVPLDPKRSPGEQVKRCFTRARKLERAAELAVEGHAGATTAVEALASAAEAVGTCPDDAGLASLLATLPEAVAAKAREAVSRAGETAGPRKSAPARRVPWRTFWSADGWEIRVGKSAADSDQLTLRNSKPSDLFLHVRSVPGAHVIVPTPRGKTVPKETLLDAAELACVFSKRSEAEHNEVDHVERRHVRKPRGARPGLVILERARTLSLRKDPARRARLKDARRPGESP